MVDIQNIIKYFSNKIKEQISLEINNDIFKSLEEIRIRVNKPIILRTSFKEIILQYIVTFEDIVETFQYICENSIYTYQKQICNGYITVKGGHRVGIIGSVVMEKDTVINIKYISALNFRIAKQIINCSEEIIRNIIDIDNKTIFNTLIVSPPGAGKTTLLRDIIRNISTGTKSLNGLNVGVVDERGEIAAMYKGISQNNLGIRCDVIENIDKPTGMKILIRSMAPDVICADEIGSKEDVEAINYAICSGVKGIFTAHGNDLENLQLNPEIRYLIEMRIFQKIIFLDKSIKGKFYVI